MKFELKAIPYWHLQCPQIPFCYRCWHLFFLDLYCMFEHHGIVLAATWALRQSLLRISLKSAEVIWLLRIFLSAQNLYARHLRPRRLFFFLTILTFWAHLCSHKSQYCTSFFEVNIGLWYNRCFPIDVRSRCTQTSAALWFVLILTTLNSAGRSESIPD
jgi:hypothetical protein